MDVDLTAFGDDAARLRDAAARRRRGRRSWPARHASSVSTGCVERPRGRAPYSPQAMRPIDLSPSRSSLVSWSLSNENATAQRAPSFHVADVTAAARGLDSPARANAAPAIPTVACLPSCSCAHPKSTAGATTQSRVFPDPVNLQKRGPCVYKCSAFSGRAAGAASTMTAKQRS